MHQLCPQIHWLFFATQSIHSLNQFSFTSPNEYFKSVTNTYFSSTTKRYFNGRQLSRRTFLNPRVNDADKVSRNWLLLERITYNHACSLLICQDTSAACFASVEISFCLFGRQRATFSLIYYSIV